jgi:hypothetical protein
MSDGYCLSHSFLALHNRQCHSCSGIDAGPLVLQPMKALEESLIQIRTTSVALSKISRQRFFYTSRLSKAKKELQFF